VWGWSLSLVVAVVASGSGSAYLQYRVESGECSAWQKG
jgi:hypothetical protein